VTLDWRTTLLLVTGLPTLIAAGLALYAARERTAARVFSAFMLAWVLLTTPYIIGFAGAYDAYPWLTFAPFNTELWLGPLWLLSVRALTEESLGERWWWWLVPGIIQTSYYTACFVLLGDGPSKFAFNGAYHVPYVVPVETVISLALIIFAVADSIMRIRRYRRWVATEHSNRERVDLAWFEQASAAIILLALLWIAIDLVQAIVGQLSYATNFWFYAIAGVVFLVLALQFLTRVDRRFPKLPRDHSWAAPADAPPPARAEPASRRINLEAVKTKVREGGWHFDPDLTLSELARRLGTNTSTLSAALNEETGSNFTNVINGLRVEAVCDRLRGSEGGDASDASARQAGGSANILAMALDCGFGSKATFNRAFKRHTGQTPREWAQQEAQG